MMRPLKTSILGAAVLALIGLTPASAQSPANPIPLDQTDYKTIAAIHLEALGQCNQQLGPLQQLRAREMAGLVGDVARARALATQQTEERLAAAFAKENPGKVLDPKTGKVTVAVAGK